MAEAATFPIPPTLRWNHGRLNVFEEEFLQRLECPPFCQYNKRLWRQKAGGACLYMPLDGHWLASFEVIPPSPKLALPRPKQCKFPIENCSF